ncbi:FxsA family protein [Gottfriedia sp. NPDC056225]|uniref:FxsA family protein n=1 Tax=Gottfriedia sp. NPDC056225 TaxID=3345751 RepID=UPI00155918B4|nr:FxsA family protein [Arthrobacter citreus]
MKKLVGWLLLIPIIDLFFLTILGRFIGSLTVFLWLIGTFLIGIYIMRSVWVTVKQQAGEQLRAGKMPDLLMIEGLSFFLIGLLFFIPGPITDLLAIILLIKPIRIIFVQRLLYFVMKKFKGNVVWTGFIKK